MNILESHSRLFLITTIFVGSILRIVNIGNSDLWYDEILTFSLTSNRISFSEFLNLSNSLEGTPLFFNYLLRTVFKILPYNVISIKIFLSVFSLISIICLIYLSLEIQKNKSYLLVAFLVSFNVFLIDYCSELRVYNFIFFTSILSIIFFFKFYRITNNFNFFFFCLTTIVNSFLHPFTLIIFFSFIFFLLLKFFQKRFFQKKILISIFLIIFINLIYYYFYLTFSENYKVNSWIENVRYDFYYHYFFSNFFGSRILGFIFFTLFLYLIFKNISLFKNDFFLFLIIMIFFSYILPLLFSYLIKPILIPRYIIFVLIPIILIISHLSFKTKEQNLKKILIFSTIVLILVNTTLESPIKKIYDNTYNKKPVFTEALNLISLSEHKEFTITFSHDLLARKEEDIVRLYELYLNSLIEHKALKINYIKKESIKTKNQKLWLICDYSINLDNCKQSDQKSHKIIKNFDLFKINLKLIEVI